jgi:hypothetical protein
MPPGEVCKCTTTVPPTCSDRRASCYGKRLCAPLAPGSARFVEAARGLAAALSSPSAESRDRELARGDRELARVDLELAISVSRVRVSPLYDDCWEGRDRCMGYADGL